jgi:predicted nucleic acid-binding protein
MKHVFLDTNILVDHCFRRKPANDPSLELIRRCQQRVMIAYSAPWCIMTVMYLMDQARDQKGKRMLSKERIMAEAGLMLSFITLIETNNASFLTAFALGWSDWGDAVIHALADAHPKVEAIVTNDNGFVRRSAVLRKKGVQGVKAVLPGQVV